MEFEDLLKGLGEKLGCGPLEADESGSVSLAVDDMPMMLMHLDEIQSFALVGEVGEPPPEDRMERLYRAMLVANHNFSGTGGATLSIDGETGKVSLCRVIPLLTVDNDTFFAHIEGFVNILETWRKIVTEFCGAESAEIAAEPTSGMGETPSGEAEYGEAPSSPLMGGPFMQV